MFRPISHADLPFLHRVYASTRKDELDQVNWPDHEKAAFIDMQFRAQHTHYREHFPNMAWLIILYAGEPVGRLYLDRAEAHGIIDITFLPEYRGKALGTALMRDLLDEAAAAGKAMTIHVEKFNPAMRLYRRLGFETMEDKGIYELMLWTSSA